MDVMRDAPAPPAGSRRRVRIAAAVAAVAVLAGGLGAWLGIRAAQRGGTATQTAAQTPPAVTGTAVAYDAATRDVVMFGGSGIGRAGTATWLWDGAAWHEAATAVHPPSGEAAMAYDPRSREVVLVTLGSTRLADHPGGLGFPAATTWLWDGAAWHRSPAPPVGAFAVRAVTDVAGGDVILVTQSLPFPLRPPTCVPVAEPVGSSGCAGESAVRTYRWSGGAWTDTGAGLPLQWASSVPELVTDPVSGRPMGFASSTPVPACVVPQPAPATATATPVTAPGATPAVTPGRPLLTPPPAVGTPPAVPTPPDATRSPEPAHMLPCPARATPLTGAMTMSRWDGSRWGPVETVTGAALGAVTATPAGVVDVDVSDHALRRLQGTRWTTLAALPDAIGDDAAVADDPSAGALVVFGGLLASATGHPMLSTMTWTWNGAAWTQHGGTTVPVPVPPAYASPLATVPPAVPPQASGGAPGSPGAG